MEIETVEDLSNQIANWLGVYGACKSTDKDGCNIPCRDGKFCCRVGFMIMMEERMRQAVENDKKLEIFNKH